MDKKIMVMTPGKTDPIRGEYDGPGLHIVRWYKPHKVYLILSEEIARQEEEYQTNQEAIHLLDSECEVKLIPTGIVDPHSFDNISVFLPQTCDEIQKENPDCQILLNISSGTPQMKTAMCMIALSNPAVYRAIQVSDPQGGRKKVDPRASNPQTDLIEDLFETDLDNDPGSPCRCMEPELLNFRRPIVQMQISSLIDNYDYSGAYQLYSQEKGYLPAAAGVLLEHARERLNLEDKKARRFAEEFGKKEILYPVKRPDIGLLVEFFNSMKVKQKRGELNDFAMRLEVMNEYIGLYILENGMRIHLNMITNRVRQKDYFIDLLDRGKCERKMPGITAYLDKEFASTRSGGFEWNRPISGRAAVSILTYMIQDVHFEKYQNAVRRLQEWVDLSAKVRNPAAHSIISIGESDYGKKGSAGICEEMKTVLIQIFGSEAPREAFGIYERINEMVKNELIKE